MTIVSILKKILGATVRIAVLVYLGFGLALFFNQKNILYHPSGASFGVCSDLEDAEAVTLPSGARGYMLLGSEDRVAVLYHGNAGSACDRAPYAHFFKSLGYTTFIVEYAGYGSDPRGGPSRDRILSDVADIGGFIHERGFETVVLVGNSLGAGVAAYHATLYEPDALVLTSPAISVTARAKEMYPLYPVSLLLRETYDTLTWASKAPNARIALIHAASDTLIPPHHSEELYRQLPQRDITLTLIEGADHNTIAGTIAFWDALTKALTP